MMLSLGVSLFAAGLLMLGWAVRLNRRVRPPRWLSWCGEYGLWRLVRRLAGEGPVLRVVEGDIAPSKPLNGSPVVPAQAPRAA